MEDQSCKTPRWRLLKAKLNNLSPEQFRDALLQSPEAIIIDVRTPGEYQSGHIPGAINIDYLSPDLWDRIEELGTGNTYFVYCRTGRRSIRTCTLMRNGGFDNRNIFNLDGGYALWQDLAIQVS